jgi:hypothetical protein
MIFRVVSQRDGSRFARKYFSCIGICRRTAASCPYAGDDNWRFAYIGVCEAASSRSVIFGQYSNILYSFLETQYLIPLFH